MPCKLWRPAGAWRAVLAALLLADLAARTRLSTAAPHAGLGRAPAPPRPSICRERHPLRLRGGRGAEAVGVDADGGSMSDESDGDVGQFVVPAQGPLLEALHPARGEDDDHDLPRVESNCSSFSITIMHGAHNLTTAGEVALCRRVQLAASKGVTLAAYAQPPPRGELFPSHGGGRLHFMEGATGSTLTGIQMTAVHLQCAIICSSAVFFDRCELRTSHGNSDVSVLFVHEGGHATIASSVLGGVTVQDQASQAVVVHGSGAEAVLANSVLENCYGSTVIVCNNASARLSTCHLRDSYAACAVLDDNVPLGETVLEARIEVYACVVQCAVGMWRDDCRPKSFLEVNTTYSEYEFKELAELDIDGREGRIVLPKMRW